MKVAMPRLVHHGAESRVVTQVEFGGECHQWWVGVPRAHEGLLDLGMSPWVPVATLVAAAIGEDLTIEGTVSPTQLRGATHAAVLCNDWWRWRSPNIEATSAAQPFAPGHGTGLLFTRGIDSTATLIESMRGIGPRVTHLLSVADLEPNHSPSVAAMVLLDTKRAAASVGLPLIAMTTNLRTEVERYVNWERSFGTVLISTALALGPLLETLLISSTLNDKYRKPHGSTPELDEGWSTDRTKVLTTQRTLSRNDKVALVGSEPNLARQIKICWAGNQRRNCGRCTKCLMTMTALVVDGGDAALETFEATLSAEAIRRLVPATLATDDLIAALPGDAPYYEVLWPSNMESLLDRIAPLRPDLAEAWFDYRARGLYGQRAGLADSAALDITRGRVDLGIARGWGGPAQPLTVAAAMRQQLCDTNVETKRPLRWSIAQRVAHGPSQIASLLSERWGRGAVMLLDAITPGLPPHAVQRLLNASTMRCWWSDAPYLEGVPLLEAITHGCVPLQITTDDRAAQLRGELGPTVGALVIGLAEIERGYLDAEQLQRCHQAAVQLVVTGSRERDQALAVHA